MHWSGPGRPARALGSFQSVASMLCVPRSSGFSGEPHWLSNQLRVFVFLGSGLRSGVKVVQLCPTLCDYTVHEILQARILEWVALPFSRGSSQPRDQTQVSHISGGLFTS